MFPEYKVCYICGCKREDIVKSQDGVEVCLECCAEQSIRPADITPGANESLKDLDDIKIDWNIAATPIVSEEQRRRWAEEMDRDVFVFDDNMNFDLSEWDADAKTPDLRGKP